MDVAHTKTDIHTQRAKERIFTSYAVHAGHESNDQSAVVQYVAHIHNREELIHIQYATVVAQYTTQYTFT